LTLAQDNAVPRRYSYNLTALQSVAVWLMFAASFFVQIEPAPVDIMFVVVVALFVSSGLGVNITVLPIIFFLLLYNVGGVMSYVPIAPDERARMFVITSVYMGCTAAFFALYMAQDTLRHMAVIKNGWVIAATMAAALGIIGALKGDGIGAPFQAYGRAMGGFKDPNVFSTYLILPAVMLVHGFLTGTQRYRPIALLALMTILAGLFLAFSRGAWVNLTVSVLMMIMLTFALSPTLQLRGRIVIIAVIGVLLVGGLLAVLLSLPEFRSLFLDRFTLVKDYDAGETGRFGNQLNAIPMLLDRPLGFGPMQFANIFHQDPHNTYLNAFASYGWLGGLSYMMIVVSTVVVGFRAVLMRTPWQHWAIIVFCPLFTTLLQSIQIDADHWRHFYWMIGMMWGIYGASWLYERSQAATATS
jgi:hypothetical protein